MVRQFEQGHDFAPDTAGIEVVEIHDVNLDMALVESMRPLLSASDIQHTLPDPNELTDLVIFQNVPSKEYQSLLKRSETIVVGPGYTLLEAGKLNSKLYFVLEGQLRLIPDGTKCKLTGIVDVGQFAGLRSAIEQSPSCNSIVAGESSRVFVIELILIKELAERSHPAAQNLTELLAQYIRGESQIAVGTSAAQFGQKRDGFVDALTGLHNHRWLMKMLPRHMSRSIMNQSPLSMIMFEVDKLEEVKAKYGATAWEKLVHAVGHAMLDNSRACDLMVRDDNERFVVILPNSALDDARLFAKRLREVIGGTVFIAPDRRPLPSVKLSVGIVELKKQMTGDQLLEKAAKLVQQAKKVGGDWIAEQTPG